MQNQQPERRQTIFSGIQPTGSLTLNGYIGALRNFKLLEVIATVFYAIVDMHALTCNQAKRRGAAQGVPEGDGLFLAVGLDRRRA